MTEEKAKFLYHLLLGSSTAPQGRGEGLPFGSVLVIGAQQAAGDRPVVEALALAAGAGRVVTVDRVGIQSFHSQVR